MKNLKKLSRNSLGQIKGGISCAASCSNGSMVSISTCSTCLTYLGDGVACYESSQQAVHVVDC